MGWNYKTGGGGEKREVRVAAPLFVPATADGRLVRKLKEVDDMHDELVRWKFKIVERGGKTCGRCQWKDCTGDTKCASERKQCYACGGKNHFANSRDCPQKRKDKKEKGDKMPPKDKTSTDIQVAGDSASEEEVV